MDITTPPPALVIVCTIVELEPAVYDVTGSVIKPPVHSLPQEYDVPLDAGYAVSQTGQIVTLAEAGIEPPETLAQWNARQQQATTDSARAHAVAVASAWVQLRMVRDRWLAQTDYVESFVNDPASFSHLPAVIQAGITANSAGWVAWRQALRDLPAAKAINPLAAVSAAAGTHSTADAFAPPWPQPPATPVIHLT